MVKYIYCILALSFFLYACKEKTTVEKINNLIPKVVNNGEKILFPSDESIVFFEADTIKTSSLNTLLLAPAQVAATVVKSSGSSDNIILFENQNLAESYTQFIQHSINVRELQNVIIQQKKIELERIKDMQQHGAATGGELLNAQSALSIEQTNLSNEQAANIQYETNLIAGGFEPELLRKVKPGTVFIICDIPENQINNIKTKSKCIIEFTSFPNQKFDGIVEVVTDMVDPITRMVKLRVSVTKASNKLKTGMFGTVSLDINEGNNITINKNSLVTLQGKHYVFVKTTALQFERREVMIGDQVLDKIIVYNGLKVGDLVAVKGTMQLKGLSFGY